MQETNKFGVGQNLHIQAEQLEGEEHVSPLLAKRPFPSLPTLMLLGREMANMDTMLQGLDKTWRATPVSSALIKQTMGTCSSGSPPRTHAYAFGKSYAGKIV